jgi:tagatose-1,6-bisphosphate aldolase non-catalytic subunit AgaZ/GatZ
MAQDSRSPKANVFPDNSPITTLRNNIQSGNVIRLDDMNSLINLTNSWLGHYHTYDDAYQLATYGNNGDRNNYYEDKSTSAVASIGAIPNVTSTDEVTALIQQYLQQRVGVLRIHSHEINDRTA